MVSRTLIVWLTWTSLTLAVAVGVAGGSAVLMGQMGDEVGALWVGREALTLAFIWLVNLIMLLLAVAMAAIARADRGATPKSIDQPAESTDES